jgi:hypothetical protein
MRTCCRSLIFWLAGALLLIGIGPAPAFAHESQPGLLELRQLTSGTSEQTWPIFLAQTPVSLCQ